jgi:hypothetical protein
MADFEIPSLSYLIACAGEVADDKTDLRLSLSIVWS